MAGEVLAEAVRLKYNKGMCSFIQSNTVVTAFYSFKNRQLYFPFYVFGTQFRSFVVMQSLEHSASGKQAL